MSDCGDSSTDTVHTAQTATTAGAIAPQVAVVMGSISDWETMKQSCQILEDFHIPYSKQVISAHRMPCEMHDFAASARDAGIRVIIAGAGGSAHLPGMIAAQTTLPTIGVPTNARTSRHGFFALDCADAGRNSGCDRCNRGCGSQECSTSCSTNSFYY